MLERERVRLEAHARAIVLGCFSVTITLREITEDNAEEVASMWYVLDSEARALKKALKGHAKRIDGDALDPAWQVLNPALVDILSSHYERKVELLQRATELAPSS